MGITTDDMETESTKKEGDISKQGESAVMPMEVEANTDMGEREKGKKEKAPSVSFFKLFSYADSYDYVLMALGSLGALAHGLAFPIFFLFFGKLVNSFGSTETTPEKTAEEVGKVYASNTLFKNFTLFLLAHALTHVLARAHTCTHWSTPFLSKGFLCMGSSKSAHTNMGTLIST